MDLTIAMEVALPVAGGLVTAIGVLWASLLKKDKEIKDLNHQINNSENEKLLLYQQVSEEFKELYKEAVTKMDANERTSIILSSLARELENQIDRLKSLIKKYNNE